MFQFDSKFKGELKQFLIIAFPLSAAYLAEFAMFLTTKMVVGKLGYHSLNTYSRRRNQDDHWSAKDPVLRYVAYTIDHSRDDNVLFSRNPL